MLEALTEITNEWLQHRPWLAAGAVFLGGVTTAANPCSVASVPVVISLTGGQAAVTDWRRGLLTSLTFVAGLVSAAQLAWVCDDAFISFRYAKNLATGVGGMLFVYTALK